MSYTFFAQLDMLQQVWERTKHVPHPFGNSISAGHVKNLKSLSCNKDLGSQIWNSVTHLNILFL